MLAGHHLRRREIHRVEARGAEAVDLHAGRLVAEARRYGAGARDVAARLADRIDAAQNDIVDLLARELVAILDRRQRRDRQSERGNLVQRAVRLAAPARRAHGVVNVSVGHGELLRLADASSK